MAKILNPYRVAFVSALLAHFDAASAISLARPRERKRHHVFRDAHHAHARLAHAGPGRHNHRREEDRHPREDIRYCVRQYAENLEHVRRGLGNAIRTHPLVTVSKSERSVILGAGSGNTGTHSLYSALKTLGLETWHASKNKTWDDRRGQIKSILHYKKKKGKLEESQAQSRCHRELRQFNYTRLLDGCDAAVDMPTAEVFLSLFLSFPNAKVVLSTRPATSWVEGRMRTHPGVSPPLQEPCGMSMQDFSDRELARMFSLNNAFVRCLVPKDQLLEFDLWADPEARMQGLMHELAEFVGRSASKAPLPHIIPRDHEPISEISTGATAATVGKQSCKTWIERQVQTKRSVDFAHLREVMQFLCDIDLDEDGDGDA